jgi:cyclophilin family peptidyl-prolyl cis-trans isomerase
MRSWTLIVFIVVLSGLIVSALIFSKNLSPAGSGTDTTVVAASPTPIASPGTQNSPTPQSQSEPTAAEGSQNSHPDLSTDPNGLSKTTVVVRTNEGIIKFKFYPQDAPKTVRRFIELIQKGFYNNLAFHRVVPGFVIQGGDPAGNGTGGSGQKLDAEFNSRRHIEGTVAMARAENPNSADSQFYICLNALPHLDHNYTVFGQVTEGMDVVKRIKMGDKMTSVTLQ